ncbi:SWIM zinc finger family protein [Dysosmobacter sp.]|uniref:SWIM zinc finger family protein n=1 Tax=Dysosmobacter sp. TaxID=2591382 RepID=UPI002D7FDF8B|nr:SWIM zinc finger family protein [Dysosmobacter sp.]
MDGNGDAPYSVTIDLEHLRRSSCTCPHAAGKRTVCKHMVAVFFAAYPEEAEKYFADVGKLEEKWRRHQEELSNKLIRYVHSLKKQEAQELLLQLLEAGPEWQRDGFIREHIGPTDFSSADLEVSGGGK